MEYGKYSKCICHLQRLTDIIYLGSEVVEVEHRLKDSSIFKIKVKEFDLSKLRIYVPRDLLDEVFKVVENPNPLGDAFIVSYYVPKFINITLDKSSNGNTLCINITNEDFKGDVRIYSDFSNLVYSIKFI